MLLFAQKTKNMLLFGYGRNLLECIELINIIIEILLDIETKDFSVCQY